MKALYYNTLKPSKRDVESALYQTKYLTRTLKQQMSEIILSLNWKKIIVINIF